MEWENCKKTKKNKHKIRIVTNTYNIYKNMHETDTQ